jgi:hypothetical protein
MAELPKMKPGLSVSIIAGKGKPPAAPAMPSLPGRSAAAPAPPMEEEVEAPSASFSCPQCGANLKVEAEPDEALEESAETPLQ